MEQQKGYRRAINNENLNSNRASVAVEVFAWKIFCLKFHRLL